MDAHMDIFGRLGERADRLTHLLLGAKGGMLELPTSVSRGLLDGQDERIVGLVEELRLLEREVQGQKAVLASLGAAALETGGHAGPTEAELESLGVRWSGLLAERKIEHSVMEAVDDSHHIIASLYPSVASTSEPRLLDEASRNLARAVGNRDELAGRVLQERRRIIALQTRLTALEQGSEDLIKENRRLYEAVHEDEKRSDKGGRIPDGGDKDTLERYAGEWKEQHKRGTIVSQVLQGLILESGVDWSRDERWREVMYSLGEPLEEVPPFPYH